MANTTNFGWETPDDTDLVKDGAAAMRTLGNSIDSSFVDLKGGTTGQILSKNSNTDLDYVWINNDQGDITAVTAGTGISGGGTSGDITITNSMATAIDAKGDLVAGTGADAFARLAVGTNNQVLTADSTTATGLKWATPSSGAYTYITGASFSSVTSFSLPTNTFTSSYKNYKILIWWTAYSGDTALLIRARTAGTDYTGSQYFYGTARQPYNSSYTGTSNSAVSAWQLGLDSYYDRSAIEFTYYDPKGGGNMLTATGMVHNIAGMFGGLYQNGTSNVDSLTFNKTTGTMSGNYRVYGLADA